MADPASTTATLSALIFLGAAVVAVPIFRVFGLSAVLGYLVAGAAIGPSGLKLFNDPGVLRSIAELGIVMFLFVIGLELKPSKLLSMRKDILGLGMLQVLATSIVLIIAFRFVGLTGGALIAVSFAFSLSATAIALQILNERGAMATPYGQKSFAVLLFQDLAIVPFIALMPFLAARPGSGASASGMLDFLPDIALAFGALGALLLAGRYLLNPLFRLLAKADAREVMTAAALLLVLGAAEAMHAVGLSAALGAFVAGLMLAESNFRHQLEADIEPFRGLLLGLFFMSVGMSIDAATIARNVWPILAATLALVTLKFVINYLLLRINKLGISDSARAAVLLSTTGEFAFVIVPLALSLGMIRPAFGSVLTAIAALTMFIGPLAAKGLEPLLALRARRMKKQAVVEEDYTGAEGEALVIGFGRYGQIVTQVLLAAERKVTVIDRNIDQIKTAARFGFKVYYGDGKRLDVLRASGADQAAVIAICIDDREAASTIAEMAKRAFPQARLIARAYDRTHALDLMEHGIRAPFRETFESALAFGQEALISLGMSEGEAAEVRDDVRRRDLQRLIKQRDDGALAGLDLLRGDAIKPEPLSQPRREGQTLSPSPQSAPVTGDGTTGASS